MITWFGLGMAVGSCFGLFAACLLMAAREPDKWDVFPKARKNRKHG